MLIYLGADHRGFALKETLKKHLGEAGYETADLGASEIKKDDDYNDFAFAVAREISRDPETRKGILCCGSGVGMDIVANKFRNVRCSLCFSPDQAMAARKEDDANILALPADFLNEEMAKKIASVWIQTLFSGEDRYQRRLKKIEDLELKITDYSE